MYVCLCNAVTDTQIIKELDNGAKNLRDVSRCLGVGKECGKCCKSAKKVIHQYHDENKMFAKLAYAAG